MRWRSAWPLGLSAIFIIIVGTLAWQLRSPVRRLASMTWSAWHPTPSLTFAVVGDNHGVTPAYREILRQLPAQHPAFLLNLADATEHGTTEEFTAVRQAESALAFPVYHTVGNHDILSDDSRQLFQQAFGQAPWQSIDLGQLHLVILDNADRKVGFSEESITWLARDLAAHQQQTIIVAYHRPFGLPLAQLTGDDETRTSAATNRQVTALFKQYHVRYIFTAHLHTFLRYTVDDIPAVVSGGGGGAAQALLGGPSHNYFHYLLVTVKGANITVDVRRVSP